MNAFTLLGALAAACLAAASGREPSLQPLGDALAAGARVARQAQGQAAAARAAKPCEQNLGLTQSEFTLLYELDSPDKGMTLSFTGGKCWVEDEDHGHPIVPRAKRLFFEARRRLLVTTLLDEPSSSIELQLSSGETVDYLGVVDNERLLSGQPIALGKTWLPNESSATLTPHHNHYPPNARLY
jgi:hypothetical protein